MQSEELEDSRSSYKEAPIDADMTVGATIESSSIIKPQNQCNSQYCSDSEYSLDRLKLESYIEKIIPDSPTTSEILDEESNNSTHPPSLVHQKDNPVISSESFKDLQEQNSNESIRSWLQRITQMQNEIQKKIISDNNRELSEVVSTNKISNSNSTPTIINEIQKPSRIVKYEDLPYMGEMTLDNSKPRRGRKPKKADICHLIYKNYGTIFPGIPELSKETASNGNINKKKSLEISGTETLPQPNLCNSKSSVQNKIISSLLEKRLTQETKRNDALSESLTIKLLRPQDSSLNGQNQDEPLNLCIRDLNQLKIRLLRKHSNTYMSDSMSEIKSEPKSDDEVEFINETSSFSGQQTPDLRVPALSMAELTSAPSLPDQNLENGIASGGYIYWPNAGVFIHPMALQQQLIYYQKMAANNNNNNPLLNQNSRPAIEGPVKPTSELRKLAPKIRPKKTTDVFEESENQNHETKIKRSNASVNSDKTPVKRKRSAIFIPPIPAENQTNPATEVSICKFKFTGGAKPSLQEKKMLSVDSGGNFRYYSGTGDKSMRGYEFFPRETLQQQVENAHGSSTGAFLQASGEKIFPPPVDFGKQTHPELILTPNKLPSSSLATASDLINKHKKRKSRKSIQREKLEQTFKEKGFLIQTQQLESAEGATYCKFRQLRKFTRYLFRSWKDYLPGNVRELQDDEDDMEPDMENVANGLKPDNLSPPL